MAVEIYYNWLMNRPWTDPKTHRLADKFWIPRGQDNIFLDQDSNYFTLSISVFLFAEPHTVNSTEIWPVTVLWGLEINITVLQRCCGLVPCLCFPLPLFSLFWRLTSLFIKTGPASLDQMKNSSLNYKFDCTQDFSTITSSPKPPVTHPQKKNDTRERKRRKTTPRQRQ